MHDPDHWERVRLAGRPEDADPAPSTNDNLTMSDASQATATAGVLGESPSAGGILLTSEKMDAPTRDKSPKTSTCDRRILSTSTVSSLLQGTFESMGKSPATAGKIYEVLEDRHAQRVCSW